MKQFFKILFACLCALILFFLVVFFGFMGAIAGASGGETATVEKNSVLLLDMNEPIAEQTSKNSLGALTGKPTRVTGLNDVLSSIEAAKSDDKIKGIYIRLGVNPNGWATLQEVKNAVADFKSSGKFVIAYGEVCDQKSYYVASAGTQVFLNPTGGMEFNGLSITGTFFKGTIDKLDIKTEAFHCGKYKGAYEPYKLEKFSDPNRYQLSVLLNDLYSEFLQTVSVKTGIDTAALAAMANTGVIKFPQDALKNKFVDATIYGDSVESILKSKIGLKEKDKINMITPADYASASESKTKSKDQIAILYASGTINDGEGDEDIFSKNFIKEIRKIAKNDDIKAVVLRVNSPGGSALASEIIYHELMQLKKKKPIVVSMGNYAASGGYYISCAADSIFADENTLTGSIGVVGVMMNIGDMLKNKLGVTTDVVKTGTYADFPNAMRPMTDAERTWIQSYLDTTYNQFKSRVAMARRMSMEQVEELAQGHVYSGKLAKDLNLVDGFGNVKRALASAEAKAGLKKYEIVEYPKPADKLEEMINSFSGNKKEDAILKKVLGEEYVVYKEIQKIKSQQNQVQTILPWVLEIR
ncbi:MAG: signal peptide peptidase SppA [Chitinophagaceae bacterium]|nr:signal peptide peptidase SppA [Chitinophagaceae bacterium]